VVTVKVMASLPMPKPDINRFIWQPVNGKMRPAPLDWMPSGAHEALEHLAAENDRLRAMLNAKGDMS
jgi:hypothetical protein